MFGNEYVRIREILLDLRLKVYYVYATIKRWYENTVFFCYNEMGDIVSKDSNLENLKIQNRRKEKKKKELVDKKWVITILIIAFSLSFSMSAIAEVTIPNFNLLLGIIISLLFIFIGIVFDIIGVSVTAASEKVFHSMNSRKVKGADIAVKFKKNSDKVSSFCCDVIGDVCGVISGSTAVTISLLIYKATGINQFLITLIVTAIIASLTIGGKAVGKSYAINKCDIILYEFSKFISHFYKSK